MDQSAFEQYLNKMYKTSYGNPRLQKQFGVYSKEQLLKYHEEFGDGLFEDIIFIISTSPIAERHVLPIAGFWVDLAILRFCTDITINELIHCFRLNCSIVDAEETIKSLLASIKEIIPAVAKLSDHKLRRELRTIDELKHALRE